MQPEEKRFLTRAEAAAFLGLRPQSLANMSWLNTGPPFVRLSIRCVRYDREDLLAWMKAREIKPMENLPTNDNRVNNRP
jgi:predicted DNA-binding transcriptional regulator AlpA